MESILKEKTDFNMNENPEREPVLYQIWVHEWGEVLIKTQQKSDLARQTPFTNLTSPMLNIERTHHPIGV